MNSLLSVVVVVLLWALPVAAADRYALGMAIKAVRALDIPHLERLDETFDDQIVH